MIKICEHWRPPYSKHELGSGDWLETPREKWQNRSRPFNMNHKHVKTTWTINMIPGNNFPNMNCIAVIGYKLQNDDMCFSFLFVFFFSWVSRQWDNLHLVFNWENVPWGQFLFYLFFGSFLTKKCKIWKIMKKCVYFSRKKGNHIRAARVFLARCAAENSTILCALVAFWIPESCVVSCALSFQFQRSLSRLQPMVLWPVRPTQWWQEWILSLRPCLVRPLHCLSLPVLNRADFVLMGRWGTLLRVTKNDIGSWCAFFVSCCQTAWPALSKQNQFW